jgi:prevent-host-death family protein
MATQKITSREFNQDTGRAKKATEAGPVYITDRGRPSHVLLSFADYQRLAANQPSIIELLAEPKGVEDIDLEATASSELAQPEHFN